MESTQKTTISVPEMTRLLGLKKTEGYWLVHKNLFQTVMIAGQMRIVLSSFEDWYASQEKYRKFVDLEPDERDRFLQNHVDDIVGRRIRQKYIRKPDKARLDEKSWFSPEEVADIMAISRNAVQRLIQKGSLNAKRFGKQFRVSKEEILWLMMREESKRTGGA